jgi:hypothetical protein
MMQSAGTRSLRNHLPVCTRPHRAPKGQPIRIKNTALLHKDALTHPIISIFTSKGCSCTLTLCFALSNWPILPRGQHQFRLQSTSDGIKGLPPLILDWLLLYNILCVKVHNKLIKAQLVRSWLTGTQCWLRTCISITRPSMATPSLTCVSM